MYDDILNRNESVPDLYVCVCVCVCMCECVKNSLNTIWNNYKKIWRLKIKTNYIMDFDLLILVNLYTN